MTDLKLSLKNKWKNVKPLTNADILKTCRKLKSFHGVYMRDTLPRKQRGVGIINLDSSAGNGTHWALFQITDKCYYIDSYGFPAPNELEQYFDDDYFYSSFVLQNEGNYCGQLCVHILKLLNKGYGFEESVLQLVK